MEEDNGSGIVLNALSLEDSIGDFEIICEQLIDAGFDLTISRVEKEGDFVSALRANKYNIILSDFKLSGFDAFGALRWRNEICPDVPFICISGTIGEEKAIELIKLGADDYILKDRPKRLPLAVKRALDEAKEKQLIRLAEEKLRDSELNFRTLADSGQALIWTAGTDKLCNYFNRVWLTFTGRTLDQELGNGWTEGVHPDDFQYCLDIYIGALDRRETFSMEYRLKRYDGEYRWIVNEGCPRYDSKGDFIGYIGHCLDITDRIMAEVALRKSERKYHDIFSFAPIGIYQTTRDGKFITANMTLVDILGYASMEELMHLNMESDIYWDKQEREVLISKHETIGSGRNIEIQWRRKDQTPTWISLNTHIIKNESGDFLYFEGFVHDISARKGAEYELKKLNDLLEERIEERTSQLLAATKEMEAFSYSVSHDLRAPLRGIHGFTQMLVEDYAGILDDEGKRICSVIQENSQKMAILIDALLAFSRLGRAEMQQSVINMKELIQSVYQEISDLVGSRERIILNVDGLCPAPADPVMIRQIWSNLLSNAIKYSSNRKKIIISITSRMEKGKCIYCIRDNGTGFDMKYVDKLFEVFQRLHSAKEYEGTGLGLAIVKRIVERHGGEVWAEGEVDKGAAFYFSLPG